MSTHPAAPQRVRVTGSHGAGTQSPASHISEAASHATPQPPQCSLLVLGSTQPAGPQSISGSIQDTLWQTPPTHRELHVAPQAPQWETSVCVSTQSDAPPGPEGQRSNPVSQGMLEMQMPATQSCSPSQALSQVPQWSRSVRLSTQLPPHTVQPPPASATVPPSSRSGSLIDSSTNTISHAASSSRLVRISKYLKTLPPR